MAKTDERNSKVLENLKEQLSDDEKSGNIGKVLNYIISAVKFGWPLARFAQDMKSLQDIQDYKKEVSDLFDKLIQENSRYNESIAKQLKDCSEKYQSLSFISPENQTEILQGNVGNVEKIQEEVLNAIDKHHQGECNKIIQDMVDGSKMMAILYFVKLYITWKRISTASNVIEDKTKFTEIEDNIKNLGEMVAELVEICRTDEVQESINNRMTLITTEYTSTLSLISDVRIKIHGHIQTLDLLGDVAAVDGAMSITTAAAQGYGIWSVWDKLTSPTKLWGVASTAVFKFSGMANVGVWCLTRHKLKQVREDLNSVNVLKREIDAFYKKAKQAIGM